MAQAYRQQRTLAIVLVGTAGLQLGVIVTGLASALLLHTAGAASAAAAIADGVATLRCSCQQRWRAPRQLMGRRCRKRHMRLAIGLPQSVGGTAAGLPQPYSLWKGLPGIAFRARATGLISRLCG